MRNRPAFILVPETLESHGILATADPVCRSGVHRDRTLPRAVWPVPRCMPRVGEYVRYGFAGPRSAPRRGPPRSKDVG